MLASVHSQTWCLPLLVSFCHWRWMTQRQGYSVLSASSAEVGIYLPLVYILNSCFVLLPLSCQLINKMSVFSDLLKFGSSFHCYRSYGPGGTAEGGQAAGAPARGSEDLHPPQTPKQASHVSTHADESHGPPWNQHQRLEEVFLHNHISLELCIKKIFLTENIPSSAYTKNMRGKEHCLPE